MYPLISLKYFSLFNKPLIMYFLLKSLLLSGNFLWSLCFNIFIKNCNMKISFDETVNILYSDKNIYINQEKFEYN